MDAIRGLCVEKGKQAHTAAMFMYNMHNDHGEYEDTLLWLPSKADHGAIEMNGAPFAKPKTPV